MFERVPGYWVVFDEQNDEGVYPEGFYVDPVRAKGFHRELGFLKNHLEPLFRQWSGTGMPPPPYSESPKECD